MLKAFYKQTKQGGKEHLKNAVAVKVTENKVKARTNAQENIVVGGRVKECSCINQMIHINKYIYMYTVLINLDKRIIKYKRIKNASEV